METMLKPVHKKSLTHVSEVLVQVPLGSELGVELMLADFEDGRL